MHSTARATPSGGTCGGAAFQMDELPNAWADKKSALPETKAEVNAEAYGQPSRAVAILPDREEVPAGARR